MVEFALILPVLVILVLGIIQFGIVLHDYIALTDAVRVGAREAAVSRTDPDAISKVEARVERAAAALDESQLDITVTPGDPGTWTSGGDVSVEASYPFDIDLLGFVVHSGRLTSKATERVE
ncbi:MAG TPA: TadE/TadG family type IV pilus assembly protein [Gaiellaceae bacterium]|nr:TadE/TadG family type IV pilus assembly protein [Gaiellaceae bacterium]